LPHDSDQDAVVSRCAPGFFARIFFSRCWPSSHAMSGLLSSRLFRRRNVLASCSPFCHPWLRALRTTLRSAELVNLRLQRVSMLSLHCVSRSRLS
jgi:hypothetical protein